MDSQRGQVGIIVLLITVVMLTVGISVVSRTTTDVSISETQQSASQVLDAAQSAIEAAFANPDVISASPAPVTTQSVTIDPGKLTAQYDATKLNYLEASVEEGQVVGIDLSNATFTPGNTLSVSWAKETDCAGNPQAASLAISVYNQPSSGNAFVRRYYWVPSVCSRSDGFSSITAVGSDGYLRTSDITLEANDKLIRIRPIYSSTAIRVGATWALGTQSIQVNASAQDIVGQENKAIQVDQSLPTAPNIFEYALYSGTTISE